jgi:Lrp/AsnC family transcriptional regulator, regulator for asnA, asnC and gidA
MDDLDRQIVELVQADPRRTNVDMARHLGVSEGTVRKRLDRLLDGDAIRLGGLIAPELLGYDVHVLIFLRVELARVREVGQALTEMPQVMSVYVVTGEYDVVAEAAFSSDEELMQFLTGRLAQIDGIVESKTGHVPAILKRALDWAPPRPPPGRILVVDDDPDFLEITRLMLEREGFEVEHAASGNEAFRVMAESPADLVLLDIMMEGVLDGWDAARRIRDLAAGAGGGVPILVVSSITETDYLGMMPTDEDHLIDYFMSKPVDPTALLAQVRRLLRHR